MAEQTILTANDNYNELDEFLTGNGIKHIFLVCDSSIEKMNLWEYFNSLPERLGIEYVRFSDFSPNPLYESVVEGVSKFNKTGCDAILAVGGGSAMDVAKCVKLYSNMDPDKNYLKQEIIPNDIKLIAVPTTAGTGSEATRYAVIYYEGEKQSVTDESCIPSVVLVDPSVLNTLPMYQRKSTMLDALCHSIESFWSVNSTDESKDYSRQAMRMILDNGKDYLENDPQGNENMLKAANLGGRAINITQTTAGHAMCYKLTSLYGIAHGHAAALCVKELWPYMLSHTDLCIDPRGEEYLKGVFMDIAESMGCETSEEAAEKFRGIIKDLNMDIPVATEADFELLKTSVNPVRLKNNPERLDEESIDMLYHRILRKEAREGEI